VGGGVTEQAPPTAEAQPNGWRLAGGSDGGRIATLYVYSLWSPFWRNRRGAAARGSARSGARTLCPPSSSLSGWPGPLGCGGAQELTFRAVGASRHGHKMQVQPCASIDCAAGCWAAQVR
jgi:hypothetical protein